MNPPCFICQSPAQRVCKHPDCIQPPFFCNGPCIKGSSEKIHTHNSVLDFYPYTAFNESFEEMSSVTFNLLKEHIEIIEKKVFRIKNSLDSSIQQHKKDLDRVMESHSSAQSGLMKKVSNGDWEAATGKEVSQLYKKGLRMSGLVEKGEDPHQAEMKWIMSEFNQMLDSFETKLGSVDSVEFKSELAESLEKQGERAMDFLNWEEAYNAFTKCSRYCPTKASIQVQIFQCCMELEKYNEAELRMRRCIELKSFQPNLYISLGNCFADKKKDIQKAISIFSEAIGIDPTIPQLYDNRGICYVRQWKFKKAIDDFQRAYQLNPKNKEYLNNKKQAYELWQTVLETEIELERESEEKEAIEK